MDVVVTTQSKIVVVEPKGRLDSTNSRDFGARLLDLIQSGSSRIVVDFSHVVYISSAGFRSLLIAAQKSLESNCEFALCALDPEVQRLFEIAALADEFRICVTREELLSNGLPAVRAAGES